jgi:hypothetical protein
MEDITENKHVCMYVYEGKEKPNDISKAGRKIQDIMHT